MPSLADKLKSLGVQVGPAKLASDKPAPPPSLEALLEGEVVETPVGECLVVEKRYPLEQPHGRSRLGLPAASERILSWAGLSELGDFSPEALAFIDTETTGLSGGTGTFAFLIGAGRFENGTYVLKQFFMRDPQEEPAQLFALEQFLAPCSGLVTFNGKAFDLPILTTRYRSHGWQSPFMAYFHVDLLHLSRRLWSERLPSRTLGALEQHILGFVRDEEDIPGWMIPQIYFDYLRFGEAGPLKRVFYHNAMDVLSMVSLFAHTARLLSDPLHEGNENGLDLLSIARLFEAMGDASAAASLYLQALEHDLPKTYWLAAVRNLALLRKRRRELTMAVELWMKSAEYNDLEAFIELAKYYEHHEKDYAQALHWAQSAMEIIEEQAAPAPKLAGYRAQLEHRLQRLERKANLHSP
ncbi:MAG: ribonuclease H-like domain-containing protein [Anaerolineales bacterium]|nr:ribonuclease H-like domain-containing protein [Anaerolineales bacterium]